MSAIPRIDFGWIGGSNTWGMRFPEDLGRSEVKVAGTVGPFKTPDGMSAPFKLLEVAGKKALRVAMHGSYPSEIESIVPWVSAKQVAWVFRESGAEWVITDGSVGGVQKADGSPLPPWSVVIPDDFVMDFTPPPVGLSVDGRVPRKPGTFYRMGEPFCSGLRQHLAVAAVKEKAFDGVYNGGVYRCTMWGRFETGAEVELLRMSGKNVIVGQTVPYEAAALRAMGLHFAAFNVVANHAESGDPTKWIGKSPEAMTEFYQICPVSCGNVLLDAVLSVIQEGIGECQCHNFGLEGLDQFPVIGA